MTNHEPDTTAANNGSDEAILQETAVRTTVTADDTMEVADAPIDHIALDPRQAEAIRLCCNPTSRVVCITGQAGSGKTTIMRHVYKALYEAGHSISVCAPTGKAAKRIYEVTGIRAKTVHLLLEYTHPGEPDPKTGKIAGYSVPKRYQDRPLDANVVIVDEYAMVNRALHRNIVSALRPGGRLLVFGDINQLPPIEENKNDATLGSPFKMLMENYPTVRLDKNHRQGEGSGIIENSLRALQGQSPMRKDDFEIIITDDPIKILGMVLRKLDQEKGVSFKTTEHQVISPSKKRWVGTKALNGMMQQIYERKEDDFVECERHPWDAKEGRITVRVGSKVIQVKNDYGIGVYNGETGIVSALNTELGTFTVDFGDRFVEIPPELEYEDWDAVNETRVRKYYNPQKNIELGYALTTHKCQGSEYNHVVYLMNKSMFSLQIRPNFYTGISRARKHVTLISDSRSMMSALKRLETTF